MSRLAVLAESEAVDKVAQTYARIKEMLAVQAVPLPFLVYGRVPSFLQDFFMNSKKFVFADGKISAKTKCLLALVVAAVHRSTPWVEFLESRCRLLGWSDLEVTEAHAVAATCAMYNSYFKFRDLSDREIFHGMSVGLRAHTFGGTSLDDTTVELINVAVSDMNGCHACVSGHVRKLVDLGVPEEAIQEAVQCTSTLLAGIAFLTAAGY